MFRDIALDESSLLSVSTIIGFMDLLDFIFPKRCVGCGEIGKYFCESCRTKIHPIAPNEPICPMCGRLAFEGITHPYCRSRYSLDGLTSYFHYEGVVQKAIKAIKYRLVSDLAKEFVAPASVKGFSDYVLIPIPLHSKRYRERGFNQAEVLGKLIARRLNITARTAILRRTRATPPQAEISEKKKRLENMKNSFVSKEISGNILLFDDVCTTGATLRNAAGALKRAGANHVWAMTIAR
jgi:competence protein ComFC